MSDFCSPYDILELNENATMIEIKHRYRSLVRRVHPDKNKRMTGNSYLDGLSDKERTNLFNTIQEAYINLKEQKGKEEDLPSDNIMYDVDDENKISFDADFESITKEGFNKEFNELFIRKNNIIENFKNGVEIDPNTLGKEEYNKRETSLDYEKIIYKIDECVTKPSGEKFVKKPTEKIKERKSYYEFGLVSVDDYSTKIGDIQGTDLDFAYNDVYIENLDTERVGKDNDVTDKYESILKERQKYINFLSEEEELKIKTKKEQRDQIRLHVQKQRDKSNQIKFLLY